MIQKRSQYPARLLSLALAFVVTGLLACSPASEGEQAETKAAGQTPAASPAQPSAPAQPGAAPATPGAPAAQGAPGQPAGPAGEAPANAKLVEADKLPAVVAKVNGQPIAKDALITEAQRMQKQFSARMGQQVPPTEAFYRKVLDGMIAQRLLLAEAQAQGVTVTDAELSAQLDPLRKRMGEDNFKKALANDHMTEESFRAEMRKNAVVDKFLSTKVANTITVTDQDLKSFYDNNQAQFKRPERAHVRHILVAVDPKATAEDKQKAKQKADALLARVKKGEDFATVAQESDDQMSKGRGGDLGWVTAGGVVEPFEKAAFALKPNEISPVVESRFGYHIIQALERKPADTAPFDEVKERLGAFLKERKTGEVIQAHIDGLRSKAKVETFI